MPETTKTETERLVVTRVIDAPRELVWKAWTDPNYAKQWWGPKGFTTPVCEVDFRVGGRFLYCMRAPDGQDFWVRGDYLEITPPEKIVFSMYPCDSNGNRVDFQDPEIKHEAIEGAHDVVTFEAVGNGQTKLTFTGNETMENAKSTGQLEGMEQILDKFVALIADLTQQSK